LLRPSVPPEKAARLHSLGLLGAPWRSSASRQRALNLHVEFHVIRSKDIRVFEVRHGAVNGSHMDSLPESRDPDSDDVCSACVRIFQKRDGDMEASGKILEKGLDLLPRSGFRLWGEGARPHLRPTWRCIRLSRLRKGFGFIQPDDGGADERAGLRDLREDQKVSYEITKDQRSGKSSADQLKEI